MDNHNVRSTRKRKGLPESDLKNKIYQKLKDQFQSTAKEFKGILDSKEPENFGVKLSPEALERMRKQSIQEMNDKQLKLPTSYRDWETLGNCFQSRCFPVTKCFQSRYRDWETVSRSRCFPVTMFPSHEVSQSRSVSSHDVSQSR